MDKKIITWLLTSGEPWTRYRTLVDLLNLPQEDREVKAARLAMLAHPQVQALIADTGAWPGYALRRHNDANHLIYKFSTLADFGLHSNDRGMASSIKTLMAHQSSEGAFQSMVNIPRAFGGTDEDMWTWILCDTPTLLYALLAMGFHQDNRVQKAVEHLESLVEDNGWRCVAAPELGKFKGPGRRTDPCPIANVYALKALSLASKHKDCPATRAGVEVLLSHWQHRTEYKLFLFGVGSDYHKLKYPFIWYDILHVTDVLSRFPFARTDSRFQEMLAAITEQANSEGLYTAGSMYQAWKGWSFADKKHPSPWLTFLVNRIIHRVNPLE